MRVIITSVWLSLFVLGTAWAGPQGDYPSEEPLSHERGKRPPPPPGMEHAPPPAELMEHIIDNEDAILDRIKQRRPELYEELLKKKKTDPKGYVRSLVRFVRMGKQRHRDPQLETRHHELRTLHQELGQLAEGFESLPTDEQEERRAEMRAMAKKLFDLKQSDRRAGLEDLKRRLEVLEAEISDRENTQDQIIERHVERLLNPAPSL